MPWWSSCAKSTLRVSCTSYRSTWKPKLCACARPAPPTTTKAATSTPATMALHTRTGCVLGVEVGLEIFGGAEAEGAREQHGRERLLRRVVVAHGAVVI